MMSNGNATVTWMIWRNQNREPEEELEGESVKKGMSATSMPS